MNRFLPPVIFFAAVGLGLGLIVVLRAGVQDWVYRPLCLHYLSATEGEDAGRYDFVSFESSIWPARYTCTFTRTDTRQIAPFALQPHDPGRGALIVFSVVEMLVFVVIYGLILSAALGYASRFAS